LKKKNWKKKKKKDINECLTNNGGCDVNANCTNTPGSHTCACKLGFNGNGIHCFQCLENEYPFNETTCLSCPENSSSELGSTSILDCKCTSFNHYPNNQTSTCTPCPLGYLLDEISNICQSNLFFFGFFFIYLKNQLDSW